MGADGVQMGTRFLATEESSATNDYKQAVLGAKEEDINVRSRVRTLTLRPYGRTQNQETAKAPAMPRPLVLSIWIIAYWLSALSIYLRFRFASFKIPREHLLDYFLNISQEEAVGGLLHGYLCTGVAQCRCNLVPN